MAAEKLAEISRWSSIQAGIAAASGGGYPGAVSEMNENPPPVRYRWPWWVLAAVLLFFALAVLWMSLAVRREREERGFNPPTPPQAR